MPMYSGPTRSQLREAAYTIDAGQYFAAAAGGRTAFASTSGDSVGLTGETETLLAWLDNPVDSGVDLHVYRLFAGATINVELRRYRNATTPQVVGTPTLPLITNRGGGSDLPKAKFYKTGQFTYTPAPAHLTKVMYVAGYTTDEDMVNGSLILRPGQFLVWTVEGQVGNNTNYLASIEVVWWEEAALP